tara:strand:+ start:14 stop:373 length:360 start_codon:yes stop_codon:yes gene_type:complete
LQISKLIRELKMAKYLLLASYTSESWSAQIENPRNRIELLRPVFESIGGSINEAYFTFGDYDIAAIYEAPDNINAAALAISFSASGGLKNVRTVPLISIEDGLKAITKAGEIKYTPPAG